MNDAWYILRSDGAPDGPWSEEEILDMLDTGELTRDDRCVNSAGGPESALGEVFQTITPADDDTSSPSTAPRPWKPAAFPSTEDTGPEASAAPAPERMVYCAHPCVLKYWRSGLAAFVCAGGGWVLRDWLPGLLAAGLLGGTVILFATVLRRLSTRYLVTAGRVEVISGLISKSSREMRVRDIRAIHVLQPGLAGLLGMGTVVFSAASGSADDVVFRDIRGAAAIKERVRRLQAEAG